MIIKGFRFGMLLQLAVGPMCLMVFNTAASNSFLMGVILVLAITLIDGLYIALSGFGIAAIINKPSIKKYIKLFGCIVLILFGGNTILGVAGRELLPSISLFSDVTGKNIFIQGLLLTASNPLTIIFWSGIFSTQIIENNYTKRQLFCFGSGCVLSTLIFLTAVAAAGSAVNEFLPKLIIQLLNIIVGIVLIGFGIRLALSGKEKEKAED